MSAIKKRLSERPFPDDIIFLVLEDIQNIRNKLVADLRAIGIKGTILEADTVKSAIKCANENKVQYIVCDWNLPDGTGYDFLKKLRSTNKYKETPFIMCTTMDEVENIVQAIDSGANEYIVKPWDVSELKAKVQGVWNKLE